MLVEQFIEIDNFVIAFDHFLEEWPLEGEEKGKKRKRKIALHMREIVTILVMYH